MLGGTPRLTTAEIVALKQLLVRDRHRPTTRGRAATSPGIDTVHTMRPEVYVARSPAGGIPALYEGSPTGTGTGTGTDDLSGDQPGSAECYTWRIDYEDVGHTPTLTPLDRGAQTVYNLSTTAVPGDIWILIARDKAGQWYVVEGSGGGGGIDVCGNPYPFDDLLSGTDPTLGQCPTRVPAEELYESVDTLKFDWQDFVVEFDTTGTCGEPATGTGTNVDTGRTVIVKTAGFTGEIAVGRGDPIICEGTCDVLETTRYFCIQDGLVWGYYDGPEAVDQCLGTGT